MRAQFPHVLFSIYLNIYSLIFRRMSVLSAHVHVYHVCAMPKVQKRASDSLGLELQTVVSGRKNLGSSGSALNC